MTKNVNLGKGIDLSELVDNNKKRIDGRKPDELRKINFTPNFISSSAGSVLFEIGNTRVICTASIDENVPAWMRYQNVSGGWITAEYSMLPGSTLDRKKRESSMGKVGGRTMEIQRLIGRSIRSVIDLEKLGRRQIYLDCDVIQADGGTRTASICGAFIALKYAIKKLLENGSIKENPIKDDIAAISVGICKGVVILDLCYLEDSVAEVDANFVMTSSGKIIEIQSTAEAEPFSEKHLDEMLTVSKKGINEIMQMQKNLFD